MMIKRWKGKKISSFAAAAAAAGEDVVVVVVVEVFAAFVVDVVVG